MENYFLQGEEILKTLQGERKRPKLLLHSCCAPCSSAVIQKLKEFFDITVYYYNPNVSPVEEYEKRKAEQKRLLSLWHIPLMECDYEGDIYENAVRGLEKEPERGKRCNVCFALRLQKTASAAKKGGYDYFCTTLTVSPHKNAELLNRIGLAEGERVGVPFLPSDFKKQNGYLTSIRLAKELGLYRQDFCGCVYSKAQREKEKAENH
ncbi:MAG: epoxyqueuosine reductase QueH [Clostridiales bacterium]|nr:epoxyqueuosine reductase QueH [Clostridiales bacterium]